VGTTVVRIRIGRVGRPHGLDGAFFVEQPSDDSRWWQAGSRLLVGDGEVEVVAKRTSSGRPVIRVEPPVERGTWLEVDRDALPPTEAGEYYVFQLVGLAVVEEGGRTLGHVDQVTPGVANDVLELDNGVALPMVEDCVLDVDLDAGRILVAPGFVDPD
jgi:16S rRNA processing protein RimM